MELGCVWWKWLEAFSLAQVEVQATGIRCRALEPRSLFRMLTRPPQLSSALRGASQRGRVVSLCRLSTIEVRCFRLRMAQSTELCPILRAEVTKFRWATALTTSQAHSDKRAAGCCGAYSSRAAPKKGQSRVALASFQETIVQCLPQLPQVWPLIARAMATVPPTSLKHKQTLVPCRLVPLNCASANGTVWRGYLRRRATFLRSFSMGSGRKGISSANRTYRTCATEVWEISSGVVSLVEMSGAKSIPTERQRC